MSSPYTTNIGQTVGNTLGGKSVNMGGIDVSRLVPRVYDRKKILFSPHVYKSRYTKGLRGDS